MSGSSYTTCARLMTALEDLAAQEETCIREEDWEMLTALQSRAQPLVEVLGRDGPAIADVALTTRVARWSEFRQRSAAILALQAERLRVEMHEVVAAGRRIKRVAPSYSQETAPLRRLSAVG